MTGWSLVRSDLLISLIILRKDSTKYIYYTFLQIFVPGIYMCVCVCVTW